MMFGVAVELDLEGHCPWLPGFILDTTGPEKTTLWTPQWIKVDLWAVAAVLTHKM